jgi:hypothetical protein
MGIEVFDDFLLKEDYNRIFNRIYNSDFPWRLIKGKTYPHENDDNKQIFQFVHDFYNNFHWVSPYGELLEPILKIINPVAIIRIKANLTTITPTKIEYTYHRDVGERLSKCKTACFYVNTNNGKTVFMNGQEVNSVANRITIFDSDMYHAGTSCTDESTRCVINFNYFVSVV